MVVSSLQSDPAARCRQILALYDLAMSSATIVPVTQTAGFSGAGIWHVQVENRAFALRRWPTGAMEPERLNGLHRLLASTATEGICQLAVPLRTRSGESVVEVDGCFWQLEPWMPGTADYHQCQSRVRLRNAVQLLARWHLAAQRFVASPAERSWFAVHRAAPSPGIRERLDNLQAWQAGLGQTVQTVLQQARHLEADLRDLLSQIARQVSTKCFAAIQNLTGVSQLAVPLQPCLRDIWHDHVLFTNEEVTGLIDPGACRTENVSTDLARLLGSLLEDNRQDWAFALECYQQIRPLHLDEIRLLSAFDQSGVVLSGITWCEWLLIQRRSFANREAVLERLKTVLRRLEHCG